MEPKLETVEIKKLDYQGRIILPKKWRKNIEEVKVIVMEDRLIIKPKNKKSFLDSTPIKVDLKASLDDWDAVKAELMGYDEIY